MQKAINKALIHPVVKDWLQLIFLGIAGELVRRTYKPLFFWLWRVVSVTSVHSASDESFDWLMGKHLKLTAASRVSCSVPV